MSSPQHTNVPPPALVTVTSLPHILHRYFSPTSSTAMVSSFKFPIIRECKLYISTLSPVARISQNHEWSLFHIPIDKVPVNQIPECFDVFSPGISVIDVIGMFQDIACQQRCLSFYQWSARIAGSLD